MVDQHDNVSDATASHRDANANILVIAGPASRKQQERAFQWLEHHVFKDFILSVLRRLRPTLTKEDLEDLYNDILQKAWEQIPGLRKLSDPVYDPLYLVLGWLRIVIRREVSKCKPILEVQLEAAEEYLLPPSDLNVSIDLERFLKTLSRTELAIVLLRKEGYDFEDIGRVIGKTEVTARKCATRIKKKAEKWFERKPEFPPAEQDRARSNHVLVRNQRRQNSGRKGQTKGDQA